MNIGIDFRMGGTLSGGIGRYILELTTRMVQLEPQSTFYIFYSDTATSEAELSAFRSLSNVVLVVCNIRHYSIAEQLLLPRVLSKYALDIMHFPNFNVPVWYRGAYVVTIHDMVHHKISGHKKSRLLYFWGYKYVMQKAADRARLVISVSEAAKKDIIELLGIPAEKVEVIYESGVLVPQSDDTVQKVKRTFLLTRPYFLFVGTLERKKNVVMLTKAFDLFLSKYKLDMDLVLAGKVDSHYPEIKTAALQVAHPNRIVFTGYVDDTALAALYQGAYAFTTASLHEGFGMPGIEAMNFGLPILASNTEVFNEVYDNAAVYFNPEDPADIAEKMRLVATDKQFYAQMQEKSLYRGVFFSWDEEAAQTLEVYRKALQ
jgi:glycosyltransferase involved in cell wall biosynthesis